MNIKMIIEYDGTDFFGWQRQKDKRSIQGVIEKVLTKIYKEKIEIDGAGRTDAGVHAYGQVATFKAPVNIPLKNLKIAINNFLKSDVRITSLEEVEETFHARYSATGKTYVYKIYQSETRDVFKARGFYQYPYDLDIELMRKAAKLLMGKHNFEGFKASGSSAQNPIRTLHDITIKQESHFIEIEYTGDGFLYKMVRIMTAFILEIGNNRISIETIQELLTNPSRKNTSKVAPAMGLYLKEVYY